MDDKRRDPRYEKAFEIRYSSRKDTSTKHYTVSKNVSKSGICMPAASFLKTGDRLRLDINLHGSKASLSADGLVTWTKPIPRPALLGIEAGIKLEEPNASMLEKLLS